MRTAVKHSALDRWFINLHALHNAHLLRETLPRQLTMPRPYLEDRRKEHDQVALELQETGPVKRAASLAKSAATRARNRLEKEKIAERVRSGASTRVGNALEPMQVA